MEILGICAGAAKAMDEGTPITRMGVKGLSHQAQGLSLGHQQQTAS